MDQPQESYNNPQIHNKALIKEIDEFDWEQEKRPELLFKEMIIYRLHIRGFTKHSASNVKHKGTFISFIIERNSVSGLFLFALKHCFGAKYQQAPPYPQ